MFLLFSFNLCFRWNLNENNYQFPLSVHLPVGHAFSPNSFMQLRYIDKHLFFSSFFFVKGNNYKGYVTWKRKNCSVKFFLIYFLFLFYFRLGSPGPDSDYYLISTCCVIDCIFLLIFVANPETPSRERGRIIDRSDNTHIPLLHSPHTSMHCSTLYSTAHTTYIHTLHTLHTRHYTTLHYTTYIHTLHITELYFNSSHYTTLHCTAVYRWVKSSMTK